MTLTIEFSNVPELMGQLQQFLATGKNTVSPAHFTEKVIPETEAAEVVAPEPIAPAPAAVISFAALSKAAAKLLDAGKRAELLDLLQRFGVQAMTNLDKTQYAAFAAELSKLGAEI